MYVNSFFLELTHWSWKKEFHQICIKKSKSQVIWVLGILIFRYTNLTKIGNDIVFIHGGHPQTSSNWSKNLEEPQERNIIKKCKSIQKNSLQVNRLFKSKRRNLFKNVTRSWNLGWFCSEIATRMCSVKFTFFDIIVFFSFTVKSIAIDIQSGFWTLSRLFYAKPSRPFVWHKETLSVRCQDTCWFQIAKTRQK